MCTRSSALLVLALAACTSQPSRAPLAPPPPAPPRRMQSVSRALTPEEMSASQEEQGAGIELQVDDDDDGDDSASRISSSRGPARDCAFQGAPRPDCARPRSRGHALCAGSIAERACETWGPELDARVTARWLSCLSEPGSGAAECSGAETLRCATLAVGASCVDGAYRDRCKAISDACADTLPELTRSLCEHAISAFAPAHREQIAACLEHGCDTGAFGSCIP